MHGQRVRDFDLTGGGEQDAVVRSGKERDLQGMQGALVEEVGCEVRDGVYDSGSNKGLAHTSLDGGNNDLQNGEQYGKQDSAENPIADKVPREMIIPEPPGISANFIRKKKRRT